MMIANSTNFKSESGCSVFDEFRKRADLAESKLESIRFLINQLKSRTDTTSLSNHRVISGVETQRLRAENDRLKNEVQKLLKELEIAEKQNEKKNGVANKQLNNCSLDTAAATVNAQPLSMPQMSNQYQSDGSTLSSIHVGIPQVDSSKKTKKMVTEKCSNVLNEQPLHVGRLDMRVGHIVNVKKHPDADQLYVESVDIGREKLLTVISGLVKFVPEEEMQNRKAIFLCNLKPSKMRGILSEAMIMCASTPEKVEIVMPPTDAKIGDRVCVEGYDNSVADPVMNPKKKIFESLSPDLRINSDGIAVFKDIPWKINGQNCVVPSLVNVKIK